MKRTIFIALILICSKGFGQGGGVIIDSLDTSGAKWFLGMQTFTAKTDTVKCIMLCADTSKASFAVADDMPPYHYKDLYINHQGFWQYGYRIAPTTIYMDYIGPAYSIIYLDADKKELPKNIVVWYSKSFQ